MNLISLIARRLTLRKTCAAISIFILLSSCGGGGGSNWSADTPPPDTTNGSSTALISGTVAAGAPVIGVIEAKGSNGVTKQVQIGTNGNFQFGLRGLTLPLLFRAVGYVGGVKVALMSAATTDDIGKTANITPFTDLMIAHVAGQAASAFYENPNFTVISSTSLDVARAAVTQRIAPVMTELSVDQTFDLRKTAFSANHTGFDAVLDVLRVDVNPLTNNATIRDIINRQQVVDDITTSTGHDALPTPPKGSYSNAMNQLIAIEAVLAHLNTLFASNIPDANNAELLSLFDPDFLYSGSNLTDFLADGKLLSKGNIGVRLINPVIVSRSADNQTMRISVQVFDTVGNVIAYDQIDSDEIEMRIDNAGNWRIAGDRRMGDVSITAVNVVNQTGNANSHARAMEYWIPSARTDVAFVQFSGPGLPASTSYAGIGTMDGILFKRDSNGNFGLLDTSGAILKTFWLPECPSSNALIPCMTFASIAPNTNYTVKFFDTAMNVLGDVTSITVPAPPTEIADAQKKQNEWFAGFSTPYPASFTALSDAKLFRLSWINPSDIAYQPAEIQMQSGTTIYAKTISGNETSKTLGPWNGSAPNTAPQAWLTASGLFAREFVTESVYSQ